jgi:hypothetical protein
MSLSAVLPAKPSAWLLGSGADTWTASGLFTVTVPAKIRVVGHMLGLIQQIFAEMVAQTAVRGTITAKMAVATGNLRCQQGNTSQSLPSTLMLEVQVDSYQLLVCV